MDELLNQIEQCTICQQHLPLGPRPVVRAHVKSKILIIGQAPGTRVHESGIPWNDLFGRNLRKWMNISEEEFYNPELFAIVPMGFCYLEGESLETYLLAQNVPQHGIISSSIKCQT